VGTRETFKYSKRLGDYVSAEEELSALRSEVAELRLKLLNTTTVVQVIMTAVTELRRRVEIDELWLISVSTLARIASSNSEKSESKVQEVVSESPKSKDTQRGIEVG
jgi:predicted  nucleic acid-binding Zn-ribbon protein